MDTLDPRRPAAADLDPLTVRDDVAIEAIDAAAWNAIAGGTPLVSHAFLTALHATRCAAPATGWTPRYLTAWRGERARGRVAALREDPFLRRVRVRLGLGRCLSPLRPPLLSEARRSGPVHACAGPAAPRLRRSDTRRVDRRRARENAALATRRRDVLVAARAVPDRARGPDPRGGRHARPPRAAVPLGQSGLPRFRRFSRDVQSRQAKEGEPGTAQGRLPPASNSRARSAARSRAPIGHTSTAATRTPTASTGRRRTCRSSSSSASARRCRTTC